MQGTTASDDEDPPPLRWVRLQDCLEGGDGGLLQWAVTSGLDSEMVGRCQRGPNVVVGRLCRQGTRMSLLVPTAASQERIDCATTPQVEVLINEDDAAHLDWVCAHTAIPPGALEAGWDNAEGMPTYAGRQVAGSTQAWHNKVGQVKVSRLRKSPELNYALDGRRTSDKCFVLCVVD